MTASGVSKVYRLGGVDVIAVRNVSLALAAGERVALFGSPGSGKATFANLLAGLDTPTAGTLRHRGVDVTADPAARARYRDEHVGFVSQLSRLLPGLTALENVELAADLATRPATPRDVVELVGLVAPEREPAELAPAELRCALLACALAKRPDVVVYDEPADGLDAAGARTVVAALGRASAALGIVSAIVTADAAVAALLPRVVRFSAGRAM